jgi:hypothetical protein
METFELESWADFAKAVADVRAKFGTHLHPHAGGRSHSTIVFRGQSDSEWKLKTTLERASDERYSIPGYVGRADSVVNQIESTTGRVWSLPSYPEMLNEILRTQDSMRACLPLSCYGYLVYLRHHGFPSPLLDWTNSPYIAAYFAFEQAAHADRAAVFAFIEMPDGTKALEEGEPFISRMGPFITTHTRHFAQKASYTIATKWDENEKSHYFCSHHDVAPSTTIVQDVLVKITIPRRDRIQALRELEDYNINRYTLFQTEDALVYALGLRAFDMAET